MQNVFVSRKERSSNRGEPGDWGRNCFGVGKSRSECGGELPREQRAS